jgi:hypothetical protein
MSDGSDKHWKGRKIKSNNGTYIIKEDGTIEILKDVKTNS